MHRFFVKEPIRGEGCEIALSKEESLHAARVLRLKPGEEIRLLDGENLYAAELMTVNEQATLAKVLRQLPSPESGVRITLVQGLPKADKLETIVQKTTELGVWEILPVEMERSVAKMDKPDKQSKKQERLQRIALEAAKQSGRAHVPQVMETKTFAAVCQTLQNALPAYDAVWVAWEEEQSLRLSSAVQQRMPFSSGRIAVVVGPEGGISQGEWEALKALGAVSVTLGKRILRTETAGMCALSVILATLGEM